MDQNWTWNGFKFGPKMGKKSSWPDAAPIFRQFDAQIKQKKCNLYSWIRSKMHLDKAKFRHANAQNQQNKVSKAMQLVRSFVEILCSKNSRDGFVCAFPAKTSDWIFCTLQAHCGWCVDNSEWKSAYVFFYWIQAKLETKALKAKRPGFTDERYNETSYYFDCNSSE